MKRSIVISIAVLFLAFTVGAPYLSAAPGHDHKTEMSAKDKKCCSKDASKCCGAKKDGKKAKMCGKCGEYKGSKKCCAKDAKKCSKCGLHKGSPGCCKPKDNKKEKK